RRLGNEITYQYHDLFRAFLRNRAIERFTPDKITSITRESARLLLAEGLVDEAFGLFALAEDWEGAEQIFISQARILITSGRWRTLEDWGTVLPVARMESNPWLRYWLGQCKALVDPFEALPILDATYSSFIEKGDRLGQLLCAATALETLHFVVEHWETMGLWLERLKTGLESQQNPLLTDDDLRVHTALFWAAENSDPGSSIVVPT